MILGKQVTVTVDRPMGSVHPKHKDMIYPINYGYVSGVPSPDGDNQDAYILGVDHPVDSFTGVIIAVIYRKNDVESKWVVAPSGMVFYEPQIRQIVHFTEQYFIINIRCLYEKSCGAVLYTRDGSSIRYLLIQNREGNIGFPKGHIEQGESEIDTAIREIKEETGLNVTFNPRGRAINRYRLRNGVYKEVVYFLARFNIKDRITIPIQEIGDYHLVSYSQAIKLLKFENDRNILTKFRGFI